MMNNQKEFMMFYHTSVRNIGLFTSLALASLGASTKSKIVPLKLISLFFISSAFFVNYNLIKDYEKYKLKNKHDIVDKWMKLPKTIIMVNTVFLFVIIYRIMKHFDIY